MNCNSIADIRGDSEVPSDPSFTFSLLKRTGYCEKIELHGSDRMYDVFLAELENGLPIMSSRHCVGTIT